MPRSTATPSPGSAITAGSTPCAPPDGGVRGTCGGSIPPTAASSVHCTCCSWHTLPHPPLFSTKRNPQSHSRDDEQPALTQNLRPRLFILRTPAPSKNLPRADHRHWPQSPLNDSLDSAPKPALPFTPAPRTTRCNTTLDVTTAPSNSITREHRYCGLSSAFDSLSLD